jgi:lysophospholipase L1-like esterase
VKPPIIAIAILLLARGSSFAEDKPRFELLNGDRVVLIGGTMIERDQAYGYLETRLTRRYPDRSITFRNLGWSGDTVEGVSQAGFGTGADGFKHLVDHVLALKPTVIILGYGANEAFEGKAGLPRFLANLGKLLKAIEPTKARLVFLSPTRQENLGPPLPDPTAHNADLALYRDAIKVEAEKRGAAFVDLYSLLTDGAESNPRHPLTENGIHFSPYGYWRLSAAIETALIGGTEAKFGEPLNVFGPDIASLSLNFETEVRGMEATSNGFSAKFLDRSLPGLPFIEGRFADMNPLWMIKVANLKTGRYILKVDGKPVAKGDAASWKSGIMVTKGPQFDQVEALRQAINAKNELYFYRWRPQNETYLFGFRKHEQGQNAREIPLFDPLVAAKEAEIAKLRVPVPHVYELIREGEVGQ